MRITRPNRLDIIRLIFFSTGESEFRQFEFNLRKVLIMLLVGAVACTGIFWGSVAICNKLFQDNTNISLANTNEYLKKKIKQLQSNIERINGKLIVLEEDTEDLEVLVGLNISEEGLDPEVRNLLTENDLVMASLPVDYEYRAEKMTEYLDVLEKRLQLAVNIQDKIEDKFLQTQKEIKHIPSIRPIQGAKVTDRFGKRKDPFVERVKHHNGIDLSARYGTKVFAAASGTVEFTRVRYRLNKGYGRVVIINHGYGYKTLYGHLSKINVKPGQKVDRWHTIGLSGDTGRATGPHLHYEVWHTGRAQNPEDFILN